MPLLQDKKIKKVFHNALFDLAVMPEIDRTNISDTNIMARLLGHTETKLAILAKEIGMVTTPASEMLGRGQTMADLPDIDVARHCCDDTKATFALYHEYYPQIDKEYYQVELDVIPILLDMSARGLKIHQGDLAKLEEEYQSEVDLYSDMLESVGIKPTSNQQIGMFLAYRKNFLPLTKSRKQLRVDKDALEFLNDPWAAVVLKFRENNKLLTTYIRPLKGQDRMYFELGMETGVGRLNSSNRNVQNIPEKTRHVFVPDSGTFTTGDYSQEHLRILMHMCLHPDTKVLKANLTWVNISDITIGDKLIGIEEFPQSNLIPRKLKSTIVTATSKLKDIAYRIEFDNGQVVVASGNHPWLRINRPSTWKNQKKVDWIETKNLVRGTKIKFLCRPWETDQTREAGYLAGLLDGEGSAFWEAITFGQNPGLIMEKFKSLLVMKGFNPKMTRDSQTNIYGLGEQLRLLGTIRPLRLLDKSEKIWVDREPKIGFATVVDVYEIGKTELVNIETDTHTFIAEGLFTHNSGDRNMRRIYEEGDFGGDLHQFTAQQMNIPRKVGRNVNYSIVYGGTPSVVSQYTKVRDRRKCQDWIDGWFRTFPDAAEWIKHAQRVGLEEGWSLPTLFGRRIKIPDEYEDGMKNKSVNYPILGSDGEVIKRALLICKRHNLPLAVTVHDSISCDGDIEFPIEELENLAPVHLPFGVKRTLRWE